ncbi:unnamed protein product [Porites evermanni]|uniref:Uncharacterized protein n=1 Tax=Porites evermanni TaxID=104178 RepID=A0ABN8LS50_9CNID|nr:unnamed protein product [Porites evermanni]
MSDSGKVCNIGNLHFLGIVTKSADTMTYLVPSGKGKKFSKTGFLSSVQDNHSLGVTLTPKLTPNLGSFLLLKKSSFYSQSGVKITPKRALSYLRFCFSAMLSCGTELRTLPAAFSLVETMKHPGNQMATGTCTYTCGMAPVSLGDNDSDA